MVTVSARKECMAGITRRDVFAVSAINSSALYSISALSQGF
jgi:hypothetical protein